MKKILSYRKTMSLVVILSLILSVLGEFPIKNRIDEVWAAAPSGIAGNGLAGITIDVNASPYTDYANISGYGENAYGQLGCAWFASARVKQLTGKGDTIYSGESWYERAYSTFGFSRGSELRAPAIACYKNHVVIVEKIVGDTVYISEGGMSGYGADASTGYTVIRAVNKSEMGHAGAEKVNTLLGYVYLTGSSSSESAISCEDYHVGEFWSGGFTVMAKVTSNVGIKSVSYAVWTLEEHNGTNQDDLVWYDGHCTDGNDYYWSRVNISEHNNETGAYLIHMYITDRENNQTVVPLNFVFEDSIAENSPTPTPVQSVVTPLPDSEEITEPTPTPAEDVAEPTPTPAEDVATPTPVPAEDVAESTPTPGNTDAPKGDLVSSENATASENSTKESASTEDSSHPQGNVSSSATTAKASIAKVAGITAKNKKGKILRCTWKKANNAWAYQVQVAKNRSFTKGKKTSTSYQTNTSIYGMKKKQTYYVRVRGYDYVDGKKVYGQWSVIKKVKIKK